MPSIEMLRMLGSGTESGDGERSGAARAFTGKKKDRSRSAARTTAGATRWCTACASRARAGARRPAFRAASSGADAGSASRTIWLRCGASCWWNRLRGGTAAVLVEPVGPESGTRPVHFDYNRQVRAAVRRVRRAPDLRRSGDRLPAGHGRRAGLLQRQARSHRLR